MKTPKRFIVDPAVAMWLIGITVDGIMRDAAALGRILETFVLAQLRAELSRCETHQRAQGGGRPSSCVLRDQLGDRFVGGLVLHTGPCPFRLEDKLIAAPVASLWA